MNYIKILKKIFRRYRVKIYTTLKERVYEGRVKYMHFKRGSEELIIVFSGFGGETPRYNYVSSLLDSPRDLLFIKDSFGYKGSYYLYENRSSMPEKLVSQLINQIVDGGGYKCLYMLGSSKGGTSAIYYGLKHHANAVFAGACQYLIGSYLNVETHIRILEGMMGDNCSQKDVELLDSILPDLIHESSGSKTLIHLLYSKQEHTYDEHIIYLIKDLSDAKIQFITYEENFREHGDVFKTFIPLIRNQLVKKS